jgi:hypothetical protein
LGDATVVVPEVEEKLKAGGHCQILGCCRRGHRM